MFQWMNRIKNDVIMKIRDKRKEGASFVSVVIGTVFLFAIGISVLTVATRYVVTVIIDKTSSDNFYNAESIMAEVREGLLEQADASSAAAYTNALENYSSSTDLEKKFSIEYLTGIAKFLTGDDTFTITDSMLGVEQHAGADSIKKLRSLCKKAYDATQGVKTTDTCAHTSSEFGTHSCVHFVVNYDNVNGYTLTIKNILVDYKENSEYESTVLTDIVFRVPDYRFRGDSTFDELKNYIVITDHKLDFQTGGTSLLYGNVYTGYHEADRTSGGIQVAHQTKVTFSGSKIISRGSMNLGHAAEVTVVPKTGSLYLQNIWLSGMGGTGGTDPTKLTLNTNAYISNDLDIEDNNSEVNMSGKYYGYSYNDTNSSSGTVNSEYSSAILVNGLNTTLDAGGLDRMVLAGRAFVERGSGSPGTNQILMGESLSVRSNQLAYLVPDKYISDAQGNPAVTNEEHPVVDATKLYNEYINADHTGTDDEHYLKQGNPYTVNYYTNASFGLTYFFLNFANEKMANEFFKDYYNGQFKNPDDASMNTKNDLKNKAQGYLAAIGTDNKVSTKFSSNLYLLAGNMVTNYDDSGMVEADQFFNNSGVPDATLLASCQKISKDYVGNCLTLLPSGSNGKVRLDGTEDALVGSKVVNLSGIDAADGNYQLYKDAKNTSSTKYNIFVKKDDVKISDLPADASGKRSGLLIAKKSVTVDANFTGLILSGSGVTFNNGNLQAAYDPAMIGVLLDYLKNGEETDINGKDLKPVIELFYALNGMKDRASSDLAECVYFQNWHKNVSAE